MAAPGVAESTARPAGSTACPARGARRPGHGQRDQHHDIRHERGAGQRPPHGVHDHHATPADTSPSLSWAGWNATFDFYGIDLPAGEEQVFRVTTYQIPTGVFTGTTYDLGLLYDLSANYFVQIMGGVIGPRTRRGRRGRVRVAGPVRHG